MEIFETGIDVSRYQGVIDWKQVAAGKQFAIVRAVSSNSGGVYVDPYFERNVAGAHEAGMRVGVYYYTYARSEAAVINELDTLLPVLKACGWSIRCSWMWRLPACKAWAAPS